MMRVMPVTIEELDSTSRQISEPLQHRLKIHQQASARLSPRELILFLRHRHFNPPYLQLRL